MAGLLGVPLTEPVSTRVESGAAPRRWRPRWSRVCVCLAAAALDLAMWGGDGSLRWGGAAPTWVVVIGAVAVFAVLLDERRDAPTGFAVAWAYSLAWGALLPHYQPFTALLLALYELARRIPTRRAWPYLSASAAPWLLNAANAAALSGVDRLGTALNAALWAVLTALVWMAGQVTYRNAQMLRLRDEVFAARLHLTRQQDRVALARELHDVLSHTIGAITMQAAGARALPPGDPRVTDALGHITATSTSAMQELRSLLGFLSEPPEPADEPSARTGSGDLVAHIGALVDSTRACGLRVSTVGLQAVAALPPAEQHAVLRVVQESLANALRHQGRGCRVGIHFQIDDDSVVTHVVSVGGAGRDAALSGHGCGMGLRGIAERLAELGGDVEADGTAQAFRVRARIPTGRA